MSISSKEYTGEFYDADYFERGKQSGKGWLENYSWMPRRTFREALAFVDTLGLDDNSTVLDFGCSKGFMVRAMRQLDIDCYGVDISEYALSFVKDGTCYNLNCKDAWELLTAAEFTHIICKDVLEHLTPDQLKETMEKLAKIAPKMMVVIPMGDNGKYRIPEYHMEVSHLIAEDEEWWEEEFENSGWKVITIKHHILGLKDNWIKSHMYGNAVFVLERK